MRKVLVFVVLCLSFSTVLLGQQKQTFSVFLTDATSHDKGSNPWPGGVGISFERMFAERLSLQGAIAWERHRSYPYIVNPDGTFTLVPRENLRTIPIEVSARYHWLNETRWKPFLGIGAHYVAAPDTRADFRYQSHVDGLLDGGTLFMLTPQFGLLLEGRSILGDREPYDPAFKIAAGVSWRF